MDVASRTRSLSWPCERPVDAKMDSRGPHIPEGQSGRHLLSLTADGVLGPACLSFHGLPFSLSPAHNHLVPLVQGGNEGQEPFPQMRRLLCVAATGLSPGSLHICLSGAPGSVITAAAMQAQRGGVGC